MIKAVGIDIVEIKRIENDLGKFESRFVEKILSLKEKLLFDSRKDKIQFLAGRFAAKEAIIKCLASILDNKPSYTALQILNNESGQPIFECDDDLKSSLENYKFFISISHEKNYATAVAVLTEAK